MPGSGDFKKGNTIGYNTRFKAGNKMSTKYMDKYADELIEYFEGKDGEDYNGLPTIAGFARKKGLAIITVQTWGKDETKPRFMLAYEQCLKIQQDLLCIGGLTGRFNEKMTEFLLKNCHGMSDKVEQEIKADSTFRVTIKEVD
jgi:hypothetical protein